MLEVIWTGFVSMWPGFVAIIIAAFGVLSLWIKTNGQASRLEERVKALEVKVKECDDAMNTEVPSDFDIVAVLMVKVREAMSTNGQPVVVRDLVRVIKAHLERKNDSKNKGEPIGGESYG